MQPTQINCLLSFMHNSFSSKDLALPFTHHASEVWVNSRICSLILAGFSGPHSIFWSLLGAPSGWDPTVCAFPLRCSSGCCPLSTKSIVMDFLKRKPRVSVEFKGPFLYFMHIYDIMTAALQSGSLKMIPTK